MKDLIKAIRANLKMSQEQLAFQMGVSPVTVNRWENGKANPSFMAQKQLYRICVDHHLDLSDYIVERELSDDSRQVLYHASRFGISGEIQPISRERCDFGKGFYLSADRQQAENWSRFKSLQSELPAKVYEYYYDENLLDDNTLKVKRFDGYSEEWAKFVFDNRQNLSDSNIHDFDIVIGPIANDKVGVQIRNYFEGNITFDVFLERLKYMKGITIQYFFGTEKAIKHLKRL